MRGSGRFYLDGVLIPFFECKLIHEKKRNMTFYERLPVDFIGTNFRWYLLKGNLSTIRE
jgi:hypothetical protein